MQNTNNSLMGHIDNDSFYIVSSSSCNDCPKKNTKACNDCVRKKTEAKHKSDCHLCAEKPSKKKCDCGKPSTCSEKRSVCSTEYFAVKNYFSELIHEWEKDLAKYNLGIQELENINYFTEEGPNGEVLNKVQFVFRKGHEVITKEFLVSPKGDKGDKGDSFTWDDLTNEQRNALKGDTGDTPVLRFVYVNYSELPCDVNGRFERYDETNLYDLYLTLPKQKTFEECLDAIKLQLLGIINPFTETVNGLISQLRNQIAGIDEFDFSKLALNLDGSNLRLRYKGQNNDNSVTINFPLYQLSNYTLSTSYNETEQAEVVLFFKDGLLTGDMFVHYDLRDWWILSYPYVILVNNGELLTKQVRISAWLKSEDMTKKYNDENLAEPGYDMYMQTTATYYYNDDDDYLKIYTDLKDEFYNDRTGFLTLPENFTVNNVNKTVDGVNYNHRQFIYTTGDFVLVTLFAHHSVVRRLYIPIIDIANYSDLLEYNTTTFVNINPTYISDNVENAIITYTNTYLYDLTNSNFYDGNGNLINGRIQIGPTTAVYKKIDGKKYLYGTYLLVDDTSLIQQTELQINNFRLVSIKQDGMTPKTFSMHFAYNDNGVIKELTADQYRQFYMYVQNNSDEGELFNKLLRLKKDSVFKELNLLPYSSNRTVGDITYSYSHLGINNYTQTPVAGGRRPSGSNLDLITSYKLHVKGGNSDEYLNISRSSWSLILTPTSGYNYVNKFNVEFIQNIPGTEIISVNAEIEDSVAPAPGTVIVGDVVYHNGYYVATVSDSFTDTPNISEDGEYLYKKGDNSVIILNLTGKTIHPRIDDIEYTVLSYEASEYDLTQAEPVEPFNP